MANTTIAAPSGSVRQTQGTALQRFLQATEIDTRLLGMIAALLIIWLGFQISTGGLFGGLFLTPRNLWNLTVQAASVSVWKDSRELGKKAGEIAVALAGGAAMDSIEGTVKFAGGPKGVEMNSFFIAPQPITKDNLNVVIDAGWISKEETCQGVKAGTVAVCN